MTDRLIPPIEASPTHRNDTLKLIAIITMLIDHIGAIFFPEQMLWRTIGRIAFPIFGWQLVEGFVHTSSRSRYAMRLFLFGCVSQTPYMFLNPEITMHPLHINIMFQLFSGLVLLTTVELAGSTIGRIHESKFKNIFKGLFLTAVSFLLIIGPDLLNAYEPEFLFSYGTYGQLMFLVFYFFRSSPGRLTIAYMAMTLFHSVEVYALWDAADSGSGLTGVQTLAAFWTDPLRIISTALWSFRELPTLSNVYFQARSIATLPLIWIFENRPGKLKLNRWAGYWFYPVHIGVLVCLKWFIMQN